jgi:phosphoglycolate phosphatase-like HAD superfamily hydrolase
MEIKAVIFDLDGTVMCVGDNYSYIRTFYGMFREIIRDSGGKDISGISNWSLYQSIRAPYNRSVQLLKGWGIRDPPAFWKAVEEKDYQLRLRMIGKGIRPYEDMLKLAGMIGNGQRRIKCGLLTNTPERIARLELESAGLVGFFDEMRCFAYNEVRSKPSPWGINDMLRKWDCPRDGVWIFGDSEQDMISGKGAGIRKGLLLRDNHPREENDHHDITGRDLLELWRKANEM